MVGMWGSPNYYKEGIYLHQPSVWNDSRCWQILTLNCKEREHQLYQHTKIYFSRYESNIQLGETFSRESPIRVIIFYLCVNFSTLLWLMAQCSGKVRECWSQSCINLLVKGNLWICQYPGPGKKDRAAHRHPSLQCKSVPVNYKHYYNKGVVNSIFFNLYLQISL